MRFKTSIRSISLFIFAISSFAWAGPQFISLDNFPFATANQATFSQSFLFLDKENFDRKGTESTIKLFSDRDPLPFKYWLQKKPAPLILIIPGFNCHFRDSVTLVLGKILYERGYSVAAASNVFVYDFMKYGLTAALPGYTPEDIKDVHRAYKAMLDQILLKHRGSVTHIGVTGYSLGGLHTLYFAKEEDSAPQEDKIGVDSYIAINPPVDLGYSLQTLDSYYDAYQSWPQDQRKYYYLDYARVGEWLDLAITEDKQIRLIKSLAEGSLIAGIGMDFRMDLLSTLLVALQTGRIKDLVENGPMKDLDINFSWFRRHKLYEVMEKNYNFKRYLSDGLIPFYQKHRKDVDSSNLLENAGLKAISSTLLEKPNITVLHNEDDHLMLNRELLKWLEDTLDRKLILFDKGGHVGNLSSPQVQNEIDSVFQRDFSRLK